jgi:Amphi-Trp domain
MSHPHPARPPHHGRHHTVLYNVEERASAQDYARLLERFAAQLTGDGSIVLRDDLSADVPAQIGLTVRYERTPHGTVALRVSAEWDDGHATDAPDGTLSELLA